MIAQLHLWGSASITADWTHLRRLCPYNLPADLIKFPSESSTQHVPTMPTKNVVAERERLAKFKNKGKDPAVSYADCLKVIQQAVDNFTASPLLAETPREKDQCVRGAAESSQG